MHLADTLLLSTLGSLMGSSLPFHLLPEFPHSSGLLLSASLFAGPTAVISICLFGFVLGLLLQFLLLCSGELLHRPPSQSGKKVRKVGNFRHISTVILILVSHRKKHANLPAVLGFDCNSVPFLVEVNDRLVSS